jgi:hypothetical protein
MNISGQCHVRYGPVIHSSVMCQTDECKGSSSVFKTNKHITFIGPDKFKEIDE